MLNPYTDYEPRTVLVGGIARLGDPYPKVKETETMATPNNSQKYKAKIPAMPAKAKPVLDDCSTPYAPWAAPVVATTGPGESANALYGCTICDDPLPKRLRDKKELKYSAIFAKLTPGKCVRCHPDDVKRIADALRSHFDRSKIGAKVKSVKHYPGDSMGRVWWVDEKVVKQ